MTAFWSVLFPEKFTGYERSLERIDKNLKAAQGNVKWHEAVQSKVKRWTLGLFLLSLAVSLFWVFKLKQASTELPALVHFQNVVRALLVPLAVEVVRICAVWLISVWVAFAKGRSKRLEKQKQTILQELKDSTNFERISRIIEKYDPVERERLKQRARELATPQSGRGKGAANGVAHHGPPASATAVIRFVQSTGQALSPMVDRLASALDDEPSRKAALQQLAAERDALRREVFDLRQRLSRYEDLGQALDHASPRLHMLEVAHAAAPAGQEEPHNDENASPRTPNLAATENAQDHEMAATGEPSLEHLSQGGVRQRKDAAQADEAMRCTPDLGAVAPQ